MKHALAKISIFLGLINLFISCNAVKRVDEDQYLLTKNTIIVDSLEIKDAKVYSQLAQKPNPTIPLIGLPFGLHIYNLADPQPDSTYYRWLHKNPKREQRLVNFLSKRQVDQIGKSYVGFNKWLQTSGDAPVVISDVKIEKTKNRLQRWYSSYGYFNNTVTHEVQANKKKVKRASITYKVERQKPYFIDSITEKISSPIVDSLFQLSKEKSFIKPGNQYSANDFVNERDRLTIQLRNSGLFHFEQDYVGFEADTVNTDHKANITYIIPDRKVTDGDTTKTEPFKVYTVKEVRIVTDYSYAQRDKTPQDSVSYNGYKLYSYGKLRYRPKAITDAIAILPNHIYKDIDRTLTYNQLSDLRIFKYPTISYQEVTTDSTNTELIATILLKPRDKFTLGVDFDSYTSTVQQFGIGFSGNITFRNLFRGAEILEISGRGSVGSSKDAADSDSSFFNVSEIGSNVKLSFPRIIFPLNTEKLIPKYMSPSTNISVGASTQNNIGLDRRSLNGVFNYRWKPSKIFTNQLDVINLQYVRNLNTDNYFNVYKNSYNQLNDIAQQTETGMPGSIDPSYYIIDNNDEIQLIVPEGADGFIDDVNNGTIIPISSDGDAATTVDNIDERKKRLTEDNLIFSTSITRTRDTRENIQDNNFSRIRWKLETAGNLLSGISSLAGWEKNSDDRYDIWGVVYSQYVKMEAEYIKHWELNSRNVFAIRSFGGIAIPYGNSNSIPFTRSYFAGGANDNRGWRAYDLGPGSSGSTDEFNEANFKIALNAEYRFTILGAFKGALFADAGNIWNALDNIQDEASTFTSISDLGELALATGIGIRYDFGFFVFRFDIGFKTYNPALPEGARWFKEYNFSNAVYNIGINYPF